MKADTKEIEHRKIAKSSKTKSWFLETIHVIIALQLD